MREIVLLEKISSRVRLEEFEERLKKHCIGLRVTLARLSTSKNGWVNVRVSGEDEKVTVSFLEKKVGLAPKVLENVHRFSVFRGRIVSSEEKSRVKIFVDFGVFSPKPIYATVPLQRLQAQLVDGRKLPLGRIVELFGLVNGFPLEVRVVKVDADECEAELTEKQLETYRRWIRMRVDRLVVLGASTEHVTEAVRRRNLEREIIKVESHGFSEQIVVCKLGTDAAGLVPKLGKQLFKAKFVIFSPRRILRLVGDRW